MRGQWGRGKPRPLSHHTRCPLSGLAWVTPAFDTAGRASPCLGGLSGLVKSSSSSFLCFPGSGPSLLSGRHPRHSRGSGYLEGIPAGCHGTAPRCASRVLCQGPLALRLWLHSPGLWLLSLPSLSIWLPLSNTAQATKGHSQARGREVQHHLGTEHLSRRRKGKNGTADHFVQAGPRRPEEEAAP